MPHSAPLSHLRFWSLLFAAFALAWGVLARYWSETWWWLALLDQVPAVPLLAAPLLLAFLAARRRKGGWVIWNLGAALAFAVFQAGAVLPRAEPLPGGSPLTLLTLNTGFASAPPAALAALVARERADVVTLQEGLDPAGQARAYEAALRRAFPGWTVVRHDELLTLTRLPLLGSRTVTFPNTPHSVLLARLRAAGQEVTVVNTHLPTLGLRPGASDRALGRTLPQRVEHQLTARREFPGVMSRLLGQESGPLLLAGDLNAPPRGQLHRELGALGLRDAFSQAGHWFGLTHHARAPYARPDYVWLRGAQAEDVQALPDFLSDHRALVVRLRLPPAPEDGALPDEALP
ncbi:endonuclease/exonuclease/phosphatase family protein [uncultured Deinococcus sp.]|uniref:endonuclease/exonuclease/phosphatase family protein n=1 Tax=uncultured Deinococcus sp. TaxID=158789 RepID=UPI003747E7F5